MEAQPVMEQSGTCLCLQLETSLVVILWKLISGRRKDVAAVRLRYDPQHVVFGATERLYGEKL